MTAYLISQAKITDPDGMKKYLEQVGPLLDAFGARFSFAGPVSRNLEGVAADPAAVLTFPDIETLERFYNSPDYAPLLALRKRSTESTLIVVDD